MSSMDRGERWGEADREAFGQMMKSADKTLPFIPGNRSNPRPVIRTGPSRGVVQLAKAKGRYVPPRQPVGMIRKNSKAAKR
jgi:hypothetical protein